MDIRISFWYDVQDQLPSETGYYLAYKGTALGDDTVDIGYFFFDIRTKSWRTSSISTSHHANVLYWTSTDPSKWDIDCGRSKTKFTSSEAEKIAWQQVQDAVQRYETVKALSK